MAREKVVDAFSGGTMMKIQRVLSPVRGEAERFLRTAIEKGDLRPGDRLIEREICETLGVSRPLVREALRVLEGDGLVTQMSRGGMAVTAITLDEAMHIYAVRKELEGLAAELFVKHADAELHRLLQEATEALLSAEEAGNTAGVLSAKNEFYAIMSRGSANPVLQSMLKNIHGRIKLLRGTSLSTPGRQSRMVKELQGIASCIKARDGQKARSLTEEHVVNAMQATAAALGRAIAVEAAE
jgi:DNA-binding GntR family transcriptional regulator